MQRTRQTWDRYASNYIDRTIIIRHVLRELISVSSKTDISYVITNRELLLN